MLLQPLVAGFPEIPSSLLREGLNKAIWPATCELVHHAVVPLFSCIFGVLLSGWNPWNPLEPTQARPDKGKFFNLVLDHLLVGCMFFFCVVGVLFVDCKAWLFLCPPSVAGSKLLEGQGDGAPPQQQPRKRSASSKPAPFSSSLSKALLCGTWFCLLCCQPQPIPRLLYARLS